FLLKQQRNLTLGFLRLQRRGQLLFLDGSEAGSLRSAGRLSGLFGFLRALGGFALGNSRLACLGNLFALCPPLGESLVVRDGAGPIQHCPLGSRGLSLAFVEVWISVDAH